MKNAFLLDSLRQVRVTLNRFLAILVITVIGVAFFAGLRATGPAMRETGAEYLNRLNFMDIHLISTVGFNEEDMQAIGALQGISEVTAEYSADMLLHKEKENIAVRLHSINETINKPDLLEGSMPREGECLIDPILAEENGYKIGDTVTFLSGNSTNLEEVLAQEHYTISGIARSPLYISEDRGASSVGSGKTEGYFYIPAEEFTLDVFTDVYLTADVNAGVSQFEDGYIDALQPLEEELKKVGKERSEIRYQEITKEANEELREAKQKVADARQELKDAEQKLEDAKVELADGKTEYEDGKKEFDQKMADAQKKLNDGYAQYRSGLAQYNQGRAEFEANRIQAEQRFTQAEGELAKGKKDYEAGMLQLQDAKKVHTSLNNAFNGGNTPEALGTISAIATQIQQTQPELAAVLFAYVANPTDAAVAQMAMGAVQQFGNTLLQTEKTLQEVKAKLDEGYREIELGRAQLKDAQTQLEASKKELDSARATLDQNQKTLDNAKKTGAAELADAQAKIEEAETKLAEGEQEFQEKSAEANTKLEDANKEIQDGEKELAEFKHPEWYVLNNETNAGFMSYKQDTIRLDAIGVVIPVFFFMIAVFVTMTSMTRLVESDRTYIGTVKALGYGGGMIALRYLLYALVASIIGGIIGVLVGLPVLPNVIFDAYGSMYALPDMVQQFPMGLAVASVAAAALCAALPAYLVCLSAVREQPSQLMRPFAPEGGKRILLERLTPIWKRLSFSHKVTMRNLFRYKKRLIMTLIGVAGCTALMFTGFSLRDALSTIAPKQYGMIQQYNMQVGFDQDEEQEKRNETMNKVAQWPGVLGHSLVEQEAVDVINNNTLKSASLIVPEDAEKMDGFIHLQQRTTGKTIELGKSGVVLSEKLADLLDVDVGDPILLRDGDGKEAKTEVSGIAENYLMHYAYMSKQSFEQAFDSTFEANQGYYLLDEQAMNNEEELSKGLMDTKGVASVSFTQDAMDAMEKTMDALYIVVFVLIISAAALIFVVLFSLISINIEERRRELATIKVLGFYEKEVSTYIFRESNILTFLGILLGLILGIFLQRYILVTMETNFMMFSRDLLWPSFVLSAALTAFFAFLVNLIMKRHIKKVDMISSLKSIE